jgi:predicted nucleic acid-binding protein
LTVIIDTNVLIAMLIKRGIVRELIINNPGEFITPDWCFEELWEHRNVWNRNELDDNELLNILKELRGYYILVVPKDDYVKFEKDASKIIRDKDDIPILALALAVDNKGIWTFNTKDFKTKEIL